MPDSNKREVKNCDLLSEHVKARSHCAKRVGAIQRIAQGIKRMPMPNVGKDPKRGLEKRGVAWAKFFVGRGLAPL
jgi:hypothetical protein